MMVSEALLAIYLMSFLVATTALFLNLTGAILLWKFEQRNTNQRIILLNLSLCEVITSVAVTVYLSLKVAGLTMLSEYVRILDDVIFHIFIEYYFIMIIMAIDRFIGTKFPLKHSYIFSKRRLKMLLALTWCLSVLLGILSNIFSEDLRSIFHGIMLPTLDILSLFCIGVAYGYILYVVRTRKLPASVSARRNTESKQLIKMTAIIASTFILFVIIPDFMLAFFRGEMSRETEGVVFCCFYLALVADPITYLLIRKRLRKSFVNTFTCCREQQEIPAHLQATTISYYRNPTIVETRM